MSDGETSSDDSVYAYALLRRDKESLRRKWVEEHYDVLVELYGNFVNEGTSVFGSAYYQHGGFWTWVDHIFEFTAIDVTVHRES